MKITKRGIMEDGSDSLNVSKSFSTIGSLQQQIVITSPMTITPLSGSPTTIPVPGFYYIPATGSTQLGGYFTGSVPSAVSYPGSTLQLVDSLRGTGYDWSLTGSAWAAAQPVFVMQSANECGRRGRKAGTKLQITASGSVTMISDGYFWCVTAGTGSYTFSGLVG
jgi:hypothetical protein